MNVLSRFYLLLSIIKIIKTCISPNCSHLILKFRNNLTRDGVKICVNTIIGTVFRLGLVFSKEHPPSSCKSIYMVLHKFICYIFSVTAQNKDDIEFLRQKIKKKSHLNLKKVSIYP